MEELGPLQVLCLMRLLDIEHNECWTDASGKYAPYGYTCESLAHYLQEFIERDSVLKRIVNDTVPNCQSSWLWTSDHIEHALCEYRKCMDNVGSNRTSEAQASCRKSKKNKPLLQKK